MKFLKSFTQKKKNKLITHSGSFHADEVFASAVLCLLLEKRGETYEILRTREENIINNGDYVYDVGGIYDPEKNCFDHHQSGGAGERENGIEYSSFGLVWKKFGVELCGSIEISDRVDKRLVQIVDAHDNGIDVLFSKVPEIEPYGIYEAIDAFHPSFKEIEENIDKTFFEAFSFAKILLKKEITRASDQEEVHKYITDKVKASNPNTKMIVFEKYMPRTEILAEMTKHKNILLVVYPGNPQNNMWKVLTLRDDLNLFQARFDLPSAWGGLREEELQKITGVKDAIFCHRSLFMAVAKSKEGAIKLAELALKQ